MQKTKTHRCTECSRPFDPNPRTKTRQVTCGRAVCQRSRHAERCRLGRQLHPEAASHHYEDYVLPFRKKHPGYQQRWRWLRRLREIREKIEGPVVGHMPDLVRLFARGRALIRSGDGGVAQVRVNTEETIASLSRIAASIRELVTELSTLCEAQTLADEPG